MDSQTQKTNFWLSNGQQVRGREINEEFGINIYTTIYKKDKKQGSTVWHRELQSVSCNN